MRQAINNLQSTHAGFGLITPAHVFKVCDQPHPVMIKDLIHHCILGDVEKAISILEIIWNQGFSSVDIVTTLFKVVKAHDMSEILKLDYIKEVGTTHMHILEGCSSLLQLSGLVARLSQLTDKH